jgi:hypothetical protein
MVSDRKRAANRANAAKSSGPRSANGKSKVARNAQTHGLFSIADRASTLVEVETLARELAGGCSNEVVLVNARSAAEAEIDLRRVRRSKLALIDRALEFGSLELPRFFATDLGAVRWLMKMDNWCNRRGRGRRPNQPAPEDFLATMPSKIQDRALEAMSRVLPELVKLDRYEKRAAARRDGAIRRLLADGRSL